MDAKQRAGETALSWVADGMIVGLGTGSTAAYFIQALGLAIAQGQLRNIRGVPTSTRSAKQAEECGIPLAGFDEVERIDVTVDGADQIAPNLDVIKGLGGALLREKVVAQNSTRLVIVADSSKLVPALGSRGPVPVEVTAFGHEASRRFLQSLGATPTLRLAPNGATFVTDNGNYIYDCAFGAIDNPQRLSDRLKTRAGIVESGLFLGMAVAAVVADDLDVRTIRRDGK